MGSQRYKKLLQNLSAFSEIKSFSALKKSVTLIFWCLHTYMDTGLASSFLGHLLSLLKLVTHAQHVIYMKVKDGRN